MGMWILLHNSPSLIGQDFLFYKTNTLYIYISIFKKFPHFFNKKGKNSSKMGIFFRKSQKKRFI